MAVRACAKQAAWDSRVQICIENCIPEMPLSRQIVQIISRNKFSIKFKVYKDCSFGNRDSFVKGTRLSVLILAKSQAGRKFEVLEAACLVSIYIFIE